jgi:hypothetical protein
MAGPLSITNCEATEQIKTQAGIIINSTIVVTFSEPVDGLSGVAAANYNLSILAGPGAPVGPQNLASIATIQLALNDTTAIIELTGTLQLARSQWIQIVVNSVTPNGVGAAIVSPNNVFFTQVHADDVGVAAGDIALNTGRLAANTGSIATNSNSTSESIEDIAEFSVLTEEIGYPPSPLARPSGWGGAAAPAAGGMLGQTAMSAIGAVLGLKVQPDRMVDPKGFLGALNASFSLKQVEGHTEAIWTPRTYAIQRSVRRHHRRASQRLSACEGRP